jgi:glycosyltransferase involved in cell wall biosynthesis
LVEACRQLGRKLLIVGDGPDRKKLERLSPKNVEFLGELGDAELRNVYGHCRALLFAADEDFGMVPLEAQSFGRPVIAFGKGGSLETVRGAHIPIGERNGHDEASPTGVFFKEQTADSLAEAIVSFESSEALFRPQVIQSHARKFDTAIFLDRMRKYISDAMTKSASS